MSKDTMIQIRMVNDKDIPAIALIYGDAVAAGIQTGHHAAPSADYWSNWLQLHADPFFPAWVAIKDARVVGWLSLSPYRNGREAFLSMREVSYFVDKAHFRSGIASQLLSVATAHSKNAGCSHLLAIVISANEPSIRFLEKNGFTQWGILPGVVSTPNGVFDHYYYGKEINKD